MSYGEYKEKYIIIPSKYNKIKDLEITISNDMKNITDKLNLKLANFENRIKTIESIIRKVDLISKNENITKIKAFSKINDIVRYTTILSEKEFYNEYIKMLSLLKKYGYDIIKVKNSWEENSPYKGINTVLKKNNFCFEMQYHTQKSLEIKEINHKLYEEERLITTTNKRKKELKELMRINSKSIPTPKGVELIK